MFKLLLWLREGRNRISLTAASAALAAVVLALAATWANDFFAADAVPDVGRETVDGLLGVLAASMLSVAIFSLGVLVSAFLSVASSATPRATELVMADPVSRRAIASFIAAFIYAVVSKAALALDYYGPVGRFVLFVSTLVVLAYLVVVLLAWVRTLSTLGRMSDTMRRIERAARDALRDYMHAPFLGGRRSPAVLPAGADLRPTRVGVLTHVDIEGLQAHAQSHGLQLHLRVRPGQLVDPATPLLRIEGATPSDEDGDALRDHFVLASARSFKQDPRFGLIVLGEVAQRALSPAVNDPGTAIEVANRIAALIVGAVGERAEDEAPRCTHISVPALDEAGLVHDAFASIARDGAGLAEVATRLQKLLHAIARNTGGVIAQAAREQARQALRRAQQALPLDEEREALAQLHQTLFDR
jgi:uncharacterized membrane protein